MTERPFQIQFAGRTYSGSWSLQPDGLRVSSAYGSETEHLGRAQPERKAQALLKAIVQDYLRR